MCFSITFKLKCLTKKFHDYYITMPSIAQITLTFKVAMAFILSVDANPIKRLPNLFLINFEI